jgi:hypothetical protein
VLDKQQTRKEREREGYIYIYIEREREREKVDACMVLGGNARRKENSKETDEGGRMKLKWILEKEDGMLWTGLLCAKAQDR